MSDLHEALQQVSGVGDAKATEIEEIVSGHATDLESGWMDQAVQAAQNRNYHQAGLYLSRALD